jgi:hypothetical protein
VAPLSKLWNRLTTAINHNAARHCAYRLIKNSKPGIEEGDFHTNFHMEDISGGNC